MRSQITLHNVLSRVAKRYKVEAASSVSKEDLTDFLKAAYADQFNAANYQNEEDIIALWNWSNLENPNIKDNQFPAWDEIKIMDTKGIEFGSHSKAHLLLTKISKEELGGELISSKKRIETVLGHPIAKFAYPFGSRSSLNNIVKKAVREAGYDCAYTNIMGKNDIMQKDKFALKRVRLYTEDGPFKLKMKIKGAYTWVDQLIK